MQQSDRAHVKIESDSDESPTKLLAEFKPEDPNNDQIQVNTQGGKNFTRRSKWKIIGSAIIISIACLDPGNLQGKALSFYSYLIK